MIHIIMRFLSIVVRLLSRLGLLHNKILMHLSGKNRGFVLASFGR